MRKRVRTIVGKNPAAYPRFSLIFTLWLLFIWFAAFGDFSWVSLIGGTVIAIAIQWLFPLPHQSKTWHVRAVPLAWLVVRFLWDMTKAGLHVAYLVIFSPPRKDGIVECQVRSVNPVYISILVAMTSLIPGTIVVQVDRSQRRIFLHVLDMEYQGGIAGVREATAAQETRILRALAPNSVLSETGLKERRHDGRSN